jgi:hypothetical protein
VFISKLFCYSKFLKFSPPRNKSFKGFCMSRLGSRRHKERNFHFNWFKERLESKDKSFKERLESKEEA